MRARLVPACLLCVAVIGLPASAEQGYGPLIAHGLDPQLAIGADLFFSETFAGNGRTCATCHDVAANFTLPADLSAVSESDPLMVGDPDNPAHVPELELCHTSDSAENCQAIRQNGLILVNADGNNTGPDDFRSYSMRSIPHVLSLATSILGPAPPADRVGWSGDGAPGLGRLRDFATGAVRQHFTLDTARLPGDFREPTEPELDAMAAFQLSLGRINDIDVSSVGFLDANAVAGVALFNEDAGSGGRCSRCHVGAGALALSGVNDNFDTHVEEFRTEQCVIDPNSPGRCAPQSAGLVHGANRDGGLGLGAHPSGDGRFGDGTFNPPPLIEAADTAPFFHDNGFAALENAIGFYRQPTFLESPSCDGIVPCGLEGTGVGVERELGAMLRILNAGFNVALGVQRLNAAYGLLSSEPGNDPTVIKTLTLAREELADARAVLQAKFLGIGVFANTGNHVADARAGLDQSIASLDSMIASGASGLSLAVLITQVIGISETHLSGDFYDETPATCSSRGVTVTGGEYKDCRWVYDLGHANVVFDDDGVTPSIIAAQTSFTWTPIPGGRATLTLHWRTAEWTNPLFESTVLTDMAPNPEFAPITFTAVTPLASGEFDRSYSQTVTCFPNRKYKMTISARVGGVTETATKLVKAAPHCIAF
jgi:hypothetical protein